MVPLLGTPIRKEAKPLPWVVEVVVVPAVRCVHCEPKLYCPSGWPSCVKLMNSFRNSPPNFSVCLERTLVRSARKACAESRSIRVVKVAWPSEEILVFPEVKTRELQTHSGGR